MFAYTGLSNRPGPMSSDSIPLRKASLNIRVSLGNGGAMHPTILLTKLTNPFCFTSITVKKRPAFLNRTALLYDCLKSLFHRQKKCHLKLFLNLQILCPSVSEFAEGARCTIMPRTAPASLPVHCAAPSRAPRHTHPSRCFPLWQGYETAPVFMYDSGSAGAYRPLSLASLEYGELHV